MGSDASHFNVSLIVREQSPNKAVSTDHNKATPKTWCLTSTETIRLIRDGKATPPPPPPPPPGLALTGVTALAPLMCAHTPPLPGIDRWTVLAGWRPSTQHRHLLPHAPIHRPANKTQHARSTWWGGGGATYRHTATGYTLAAVSLSSVSRTTTGLATTDSLQLYHWQFIYSGNVIYPH